MLPEHIDRDESTRADRRAPGSVGRSMIGEDIVLTLKIVVAGGFGAGKTTTVAMDFGRITVHSGLTLHLFGTPGQDRFRFLWDDLCEGALAAIVLADIRRLEDCFAAVDYFERGRIPFVVAVNRFPGAPDHTELDVARALDLDRGTPVVLCDARDRASGKEVLIRTVEYAGRMHTARLLAAVG
ncbi:ATP/GTP-binding protein [Streptomyces sp. MNU77]|uniref:GTP-binding protein n=1 Tax=Streptomyces sp. MNU77 TaxID=1573406 RepID=UPI0009A11B9B|nr:ATP/GTP-binding protein [Streptomyces sp. MNU77]